MRSSIRSATPGTTGHQGRPRPPGYPTGPPVVAALLLHGQCPPGVRREVSRRDATGTRAFLKAADLAHRTRRAARYLAAKGYEPRYDMALEVLQGLPYRRWRDADPEDTLRRRPAPPRGRADQIESAEAHCAGNRLAVLEGVEEGAEGVSVQRVRSKLTKRCT